MQTSLLHSLLFVALAGGCVGSGQVGYTAEVSAPELVVISPGVQVIANYNESIFYSDDYYWRNQGGVWYRSRSHSRGWVAYNPPRAILSIERPAAYVHYRGRVQVNDRRAAPAVRDRRDDRREAAEDRKDDRKEQAEKRKDAREEKREDKRDDKRDDKREKR